MASSEFKFWMWESHGIIRQRNHGSSWNELELWVNGRWVIGPPEAMDAVTGMGPDPWSCGEYAEEMPVEQAEAFAAANRIDLYGPGRSDPNS